MRKFEGEVKKKTVVQVKKVGEKNYDPEKMKGEAAAGKNVHQS